MSILSRYIARQYLTNIVVLLVLLGTFVVMVDVAVNISRFAKAAEKYTETSTLGAPGAGEGGEGGEVGEGGGVSRALATALVVADLWWPRLLQLFNYIIGLVLVGAMGFTFTQLSRHRELVAMLAGGVSLFRAMRPVLIVALCFLGLQLLNQEFIMPRIAPLLTRDAGDAGSRGSGAFSVNLTPDASGRLFSAARFDPSTGRVEGLHVWERDAARRASVRVSADAAEYRNGAGVLENPSAVALAVGRGRAGPAAPREIASDLDPTTILASHYRAFNANLSWRQMASVLSTPNLRPDLRSAILQAGWGRVSSVVCAFLSLLIAMPFFVLREPENMLVQSLRCAPVAILTMLGSVLGTSLLIPGLPVVVSVFVPVLVLGPLAVAALTSVRS
ncbi:MAG: LptF/LptG family permease [Phycisphaerales bacterium]